jgi:hypothetical protein
VSKISFILVLLFFFITTNAQTQELKIPLVDVLERLEAKYPYRFNYLFNTIDGVLIENPPEDLSFKESIAFLEKHSNFNFSILNDFVSITNKDAFYLCGYVKDEETNTPLASVSIQSKNELVISDENGYFQIKSKNKTETIICKHLGYKSQKKIIKLFKNDSCYTIYLNTKAIKLRQVYLSNYLVEGVNKLNDGTLQINVSEFGILPGLINADILQTVQALPGIQSVDETVSNINIRGGSNDENLLLWDGVKMYQSGHFFGLISIFNPKTTNKVSLIKNGTNAEYSDGVSGTIEMQTTDSINSNFKGSLGFNFINLDAFADVPTGKKSSLQIGARRSISDFLNTPTYNSFFERIKQDSELETSKIDKSNVEFEFYDTSLRWLYQIDLKNQIRLNFLNVQNELDFVENGIINQINLSRKSSLIQNSIGGGLFYKRIWNDKFQTSFQVYETDYKLKGINADIIQNQRALQENKVSETGLKINTSLKIDNKWSLLNGYQFTETQVTNFDNIDNPSFTVYQSEVLRTHGIYSQIRLLSKNNKSVLTSGVRLNYIPKLDKTIFEPRLSFNQKLGNYFNLEILGEFKHQITSQIINLQNDFLGVEKRRWQLSNKTNIPVIQSKQVSLGLQYNNNGWLINSEFYIKNVDGITTQSQGFQNQYLLSRTSGNYYGMGCEFLLRKQFRNLNTWLSYSYMDNYYEFDSLQNTEFHNNFDISNALKCGTTYTLDNLKFSIGYNWHSGKPTTNPDANNPVINNKVNYEPANSSRLSDYNRIDLSATYHIKLSKNTKGDIGISILNLFNHINTINSYYSVNDNNLLEKYSQSSLGFTPNVSFRISF